MPLLFFSFFIIHLRITQHNAKERLEKDLLQTLHLNKDEFTWEKKKKEIRYQGKLFDIKTYTVKDGKHHFTGLFDHEEMALKKFFKESTSKKNKQDNHLLASLFQLLQSVYSVDSNEMMTPAINSKDYCCLVLSNIPSPAKKILTPPPQVCSYIV
jgi:hypothetical protein